MKALHTITAYEMRAINRSAILDLIRRNSPTSRTEIAEQLQVSLPTVIRIVEELIEDKLVIPTGTKEWSGGRRRSLIAFNAAANLAIGIDLGGTKMYGAVADLSGKIIFEKSLPQHGTAGEESFHRLTEVIRDLQDCTNQTGQRLMGIGVGAPGITLSEQGIVTWAPSLGWRDFPLKSRLEAEFHLPLIVDNDVNLAAMGEFWFGVGRDANVLVVIAVGTGIGSGVVIDGSIYRGSHHAAGEIGYLLPDRTFLNKTYEEFGALEQLASGTGIARRARQLLDGKGTTEALDLLSSEEVFEAARHEEPWAQQIVADTVDYLAQAVCAVSLCFDPDVVVLGGGVSRSADLLIDPILARLQGVIPALPSLRASALGYQGAVMGAIANLLYSTSGFYKVQQMN